MPHMQHIAKTVYRKASEMPKTDRRILRTRQFIMDAFAELLEQKPFEKIGINEIADLANINRSTFYLHFEDKYALLDEYIAELLKDLQEQSEVLAHATEFSGVENSLRIVLSCLYDRKTQFRILFKKENSPYFQPRFKAIILNVVAQGSSQQPSAGDLESEFAAQVKTSALAGIVEWWLSSSDPLPVEAMVENVMKVLVKLEGIEIR
jgi:AcrR family transcriptional regulator